MKILTLENGEKLSKEVADPNELQNQITAVNSQLEQQSAQVNNNTNDISVLKPQITGAVNGSPIPVTLASQMTDHARNYVYLGTESGYVSGNLYYWNGSDFVNSGKQYQSSGLPSNVFDTVLSKNTYDSSLAVDGKVSAYLNGTYITDVTGATSGKIPVVPGKTCTISIPSIEAGIDNCFRCFNSSLTFLGNSRVVSTYPVASGITVGSQITANGRKQITFTLASDTQIAYVETSIIYPGTSHTTSDFDRVRTSIQVEEGLAFTSFEVYGNNTITLKDNSLPIIPNEKMPSDYQNALTDLLPLKGNMRILKNGDNIYIRTKWDSNNDLVEHIQLKASSDTYNNKPFELIMYYLIPNTTIDTDMDIVGTILKYEGDDICPIEYNGTYIGANHGAYVAINITATNHGKTNEDVGSEWIDAAGHKFYMIRIVDANNLWILSENRSLTGVWLYYTTVATPLTYSQGALHTGNISFTTSTLSELLPSIKNQVKNLLLDGKTLILDDGVYSCDHFEVVHTYDITNVDALRNALIANRGTNNPISFDNASVGNDARFIITYKFYKNGSCTVFHSLKVTNKVSLIYSGFVQSMPNIVPSGGTVYEYIPKVTPITVNGHVYDFKSVQNVTSLPDSVDILSVNWEDINNPPERFLQVAKTSGGVPFNNFGFSLGYCLERGIGKPSVRKSNITSAGNIYTSKKQYPHAIDSKTLNPGDYFDCIAFRCPVNYNYDTQATNICWYYVNNDIYLMLDYHVNINKSLVLPSDFIGKNITVVEKTDSFTVYNEFVNADGINISVTGGYGYAVLKLS